MGGESSGPLAGIRVLELSNVIAGPMACAILSDYGAEVIKVEHPKGGDPFRQSGERKNGKGLFFKALGRNKKSVGLYLGDPDAAEVFLELVKTADVVVESFRAGTLEKWGLGYDRLAEVNPKIVLARLSGFGQTGPYSHKPAFGTNLESIAGLPTLIGDPDGPPLLAIFALGDYYAALTLVSAITMALYHRDARGGKGQVIDASILAPLLMVMTKPIVTFDQLGKIEMRVGNRSTGSAPRRTFRTMDGKWISMVAATPATAARLMKMVGHPEIAEEPWFKNTSERLKNAHILEKIVSEWVGARTRDDVLKTAEAQQVTLAPVYDVSEIFEDPHVKEAGFIAELDDPDLGRLKMPNVLFRMSETPGSIRHAGGALADSTESILLEELKISRSRLESLRQKGCAL
jgi:crotonobetainyl-CoA:carnitine CoA-transferase CaiB-like acyl-CoA transferase